MSPKAVITVGVCLFACLYAATLIFRLEPIETDLSERAAQALSEQGLDAVDVTLEGRDVTLRGTAAEATLEKAQDLVASLWGVRVVDSEIDTNAEEARLAQRKAEEARLAEVARLEQEQETQAARAAELAQRAETARLAEEEARAAAMREDDAVRKAEEARRAEAAKRTKQAQSVAVRAEQSRLAEEKRIVEAALMAQEAALDAAKGSCETRLQERLSDITIEFKTSSAELQPDSADWLRNVSSAASDCPQARIEVTGHTDTRGDWQANIDLSRRRAEAVMAVLMESGIALDRLTATGHGSAFPVAGNDTPEGRARNRRIEFNVKR